jgi:DNA-binding NtrC family response regulator
MAESNLKDLHILAVDDEPDILETMQDVLDESKVDMAQSYEEALKKLGEEEYDLAVLDIMGVNGMQLLVETVNRRIPTVMLTAHAMNPESLKTSIDKGALSYLPKEELANLKSFVEEALQAFRDGNSTSSLLFKRLGKFFNRSFGAQWANDDPDFWRYHGYYDGLG